MKLLLISPPMGDLYERAKVKLLVPEYPSLTLATLAAMARGAGSEAKILDLSISQSPEDELRQTLTAFSPDIVGITFTTPKFDQMQTIAGMVKEYNKGIRVVVGGPHATADPTGTLAVPSVDMVVGGEGDYTIVDILQGKDPGEIKGIYYKDGAGVHETPKRDPITDLDSLPYPAWDLIDIRKYKVPYPYSRKNPVGPMEASRGCPFACVYCNKLVFGRTFRHKGVERVVDEMEHLANIGFREIHIQDDGFSTDLNHAKAVCDEILKRGLDIPWNLPNGIRVDRVDRELLDKMYASGCYRVTFGVESGDPAVLKEINKKIDLEQVRRAFRWAREAGIETHAAFMLGLPGQDEASIKRSIEFAKELDPDYAKFNITIPLPGTNLYNAWKEARYLIADDWKEYGFHRVSQIYNHPLLPWETIVRYYHQSYREFYFRPRYILRRFAKSLRSGNLIADMKVLVGTGW